MVLVDGTPRPSTTAGGPNVGAIVGGVLGGLAIINLTVLGVLRILFLRRRRRNEATPSETNSGREPQVHPQLGTPNTNDVTAFPGLDGATVDPPVKPQSHTISPHPNVTPHAMYQTAQSPPPIYEAPGPGPVQVYELDEGGTDHHRGSIREIQ